MHPRICRSVILLSAVTALFVSSILVIPPQKAVAQIAAPWQGFYQVTSDTAAGRSYVLWSDKMPDGGATYLTTVETATGKILSRQALPGNPIKMGFSPNSNRIYLLNNPGSNRLQLDYLDLSSRAVTKIADMPWTPTTPDLLIGPHGEKVYISYPTGSVLEVEGLDTTIVTDAATSLVIGRLPYRVVGIHPTEKVVYGLQSRSLPSAPSAYAHTLFALNSDTGQPIGGSLIDWPEGAGLESLNVSSETGLLYAVTRSLTEKTALPELWVINTSSSRLVQHMDSPVEQVWGINEKSGEIYGPKPGAAGVMSVIDVSTIQTKAEWQLNGSLAAFDDTRALGFVQPYNTIYNDTNALALSLINTNTLTFRQAVLISPSNSTASPPTARMSASPATPDRVYFAQTGHSIGYGFKTFWEQNGGLAVFGYPITEEIQEPDTQLPSDDGRTRTVQYFERAKFEYHSELKSTPYEVQLGLLGSQFAARRAPLPDTGSNASRRYFPETGQYLSYGFKSFWEQNGELAIFGLPITGEFRETNPVDGKTYTVQYFERARFEYHPEHQGTPYETELGLLGSQFMKVRGW